jgi:predicted transcriptional regulator
MIAMSEEMPQGKETVSDKQIINAISNHPDPFIASSELAEMFDHTRQWAHNRLTELHDAGQIEKKEAGERSVIWWVAQSRDRSSSSS